MPSIARASRNLLWTLVIAGGCVDDPALDPDHRWKDGERGEAEVAIAGRMVTVHFVVESGHAITEGDIDLGPVEEVVRSTWAGGPTADLGKRWPSNTIQFKITPVNSPNRSAVLAALGEIDATTALAFVEEDRKSVV